ncbi:MAG TPA: hypothetical protein GX716_08155 [Firmicutes bacterium]|jgi:hypothetical protein|nr:hypothetical protein [Candidatus Fermentithermobacillaceae bacterium]
MMVSRPAVGDEVLLVCHKDNPHAPKAPRVATQQGQELGFIGRPIAHKLVARIQVGQALRGKVVVLLGENYDVNERVWVRVEVGWGKQLTQNAPKAYQS